MAGIGIVDNAFPCMNCHRGVAADKAKTFAGVFVCPDCFDTAQRFEEQSLHQLKQLQLMLRESIRVALVKGELRFGPEGVLRDVSKSELFAAITKITENSSHASANDVGARNPAIEPRRPARNGKTVRRLGDPRSGPSTPRPVAVPGDYPSGKPLDSGDHKT